MLRFSSDALGKLLRRVLESLLIACDTLYGASFPVQAPVREKPFADLCPNGHAFRPDAFSWNRIQICSVGGI